MSLLDQLTPLVPVSEWIYNLYAIRWMDCEGGRTIKVALLVSTAWHVEHEADDHSWPIGAEWIEWWVVEENVAHPRHVGRYYDTPISESGWSAAERYTRNNI